MSWYFHALKHYATFSGRAPRRAYWWFVLFNALITFVLSYIDLSLNTTLTVPLAPSVPLGLTALYGLLTLLPSVALTVRRLHDSASSGAWALFLLIPVLGWLFLLFFMLRPGTPRMNRFGPDPNATVKLNAS